MCNNLQQATDYLRFPTSQCDSVNILNNLQQATDYLWFPTSQCDSVNILNNLQQATDYLRISYVASTTFSRLHKPLENAPCFYSCSTSTQNEISPPFRSTTLPLSSTNCTFSF